MSYYLAKSLEKLRSQVNDLWPDRDKTSDGWIGDPSHQARKSDHNPDYDSNGVVRALDIDVNGINVPALLDAVVDAPRVAYVIYNRRIWTKAGGWESYSGTNPHTGHVHVSIYHTAAAESDHSWVLSDFLPQAGEITTIKTVGQLADEVIDGKYGSGEARKQALGSNYHSVQAEVNRRLTPVPAFKPKSVSQLADEVIDGKHGSGEARKKSLGSQYHAVQAEVNRRVAPPAAKPKPKQKSTAQLAVEVIAGKHGSGADRKKSLGSRYDAVQDEVNRRVALQQSPKPKGKTVYQLAGEVIAGKHGSGDERKKSLGSKYSAVQAEVNRRLGA